LQKDILYKVLNFGESLKTDVSYMYLANILQEFHQAQNDASTVMENDIKDKNSIEEIQATDLVEMVNVPDLEKEENKLTLLDVTEYMKLNSDFVDKIDERYKTNIDDSSKQLTDLSSNGKTLSSALANISGEVNQVNLETDEKGVVVYEKGVQSLANSLSEYNTSLQTSKTNTLTETNKLEEQRSVIVAALNTSIQKYNEQLNNEFGELLSKHKSDLNASIPTVTCIQKDGTNGQQYEMTCSQIEGEVAPPVVTLSIVNDNLEEITKRKECLTAILNKLSTAEAETESKEVTLVKEEPETPTPETPTPETPTPETPTPETPTPGTPTPETPTPETPTPETPTPETPTTGTSTTGTSTTGTSTTDTSTTDTSTTDTTKTVSITGNVEINKSVSTTLKECDEDPDLVQLINECGYASASEFLKDVINGNVSLEVVNHLEIAGSVEELENYIKLGMNHVNTDVYQITPFAGNTFDTDGNVQVDENGQPITVSNQLGNYSKNIEEIKPKISLIAEINAESVKGIVNTECITPFIQRTENVKKLFEQKYDKEVTEIGTYQGLLAAYNPVKDTSDINEYVSQMKANGSTMQENVRDNNQDYVDYTEKVYTTTEKNIEVLKTHIEDAKKTSENAVANGLADAKAIKADTSTKNQQMMKDFAKKLPYTRLGTMEYTQAYEFIADPMKLTQVSNYQRLKDDVSIKAGTDTSQSTTVNKGAKTETYVKWMLYILLGVLVVAVITSLARQSKKDGKNNPEYIGNEL
jgi:hypothetical protein